MLAIVKGWLLPMDDVAPASFYVRVLWVVVQLIAVYLLSNQVSPFFYQRF
jgi:hypothetical protein